MEKPTRARAGATSRPFGRSPRHPASWNLLTSRLSPSRTLAITVASLGLMLLGTTSAHALAYTLAAPLAITGSEPGNVNGVIGTLLPVSLPAALSDPVSNNTNNTSFVTNDVLVFSIVLSPSSASIDEIGVGVASNPLLPNPVGAGVFSGSGQAPDSLSVGSFTTLKAVFSYNPTLLTAGSSSPNLFATYSPAGTALSEGATVNFSISSGTNFTVQTTLVPEPGTFLLVASGLAMLGMRRKIA